MKAGVILKYLTTKEYQQELEKIKKTNVQKRYKQSLKNEKKKYKKHFKIETSKFIAFYLFALLNVIVIYAMVAMWKFTDLSYLGVLISDIAAQILIYGIYCMKAYNGKKAEEEMKFRRDRFAGTLGNIISAGSECEDSVSAEVNSIDMLFTQENQTEKETVG